MHMHVSVNFNTNAFIAIISKVFLTISKYLIMNNAPNETVVHAWWCLIHASTTTLSQIEKALKEADLPLLAWYDVLLELHREGCKGIRPFILQQRLLLPQYGLSRLLDRMDTTGYLERRTCEKDGRGQFLFITKSGQKIQRRMWTVYGKTIQHIMGQHLTDREASTLSTLLSKLFEK